MSTVKSKTPTPQGISALLRKAGFTRAEYRKSWVARSGYQARKATRGDGVSVEHVFLLRQSADARHAALAKYAEAIAADGWHVEVGEYGLTVTPETVTSREA